MSTPETGKGRSVLIALRDASRAARLAEACDGADITTGIAGHGVEALELALADPPSLVVADLGVPLVDASRLSEILRANPRTRSVRFLFLGDESTLGSAGGVGDLLQPAGLDPDDLVPIIEGMLDRQARIARLDEESERGAAGGGELDQLPLADLLELYDLSRKTGRIELERENPETGEHEHAFVDVRGGEIVQVRAGPAEGEKALFRLLGWGGGRFSFGQSTREITPRVMPPTRTLIAEGLRQVAAAERQSANLPPLGAQIRLKVPSSRLPDIVHPLTQEVLILAELYPRVGDVVDHCSFSDYQVLRTLHTLAQREIVEIGPAPLSAPTRGDRELLDEAQRRRVMDWIGTHSDAKLVVASADPGLPGALANVLRRVRGVRLSSAMKRDAVGPRDLASIACIPIDHAHDIDLLHVPIDEDMQPLWSLAGYGALAALLLHTAPVSESVERLAPFTQALRRMPRARIFNVFVIPRDMNVSPEELRENLALIDDASLCLLRLASSKPPAQLLRDLFARIVP